MVTVFCDSICEAIHTSTSLREIQSCFLNTLSWSSPTSQLLLESVLLYWKVLLFPQCPPLPPLTSKMWKLLCFSYATHVHSQIPFLDTHTTKRHLGIPSVLGLQEIVLDPRMGKIWFENVSKEVAELNRQPLTELPKKIKIQFFLLLWLQLPFICWRILRSLISGTVFLTSLQPCISTWVSPMELKTSKITLFIFQFQTYFSLLLLFSTIWGAPPFI